MPLILTITKREYDHYSALREYLDENGDRHFYQKDINGWTIEQRVKKADGSDGVTTKFSRFNEFGIPLRQGLDFHSDFPQN